MNQATSPIFPTEATLHDQIRWAVTHRNNARRRRDAWQRRYESMAALVRALRRPVVSDGPECEYEEVEI